MYRTRLACAGVFAFAVALALPSDAAPPATTAQVTVVSGFEPAGVQGIARAPQRMRDGVIPQIVAGVEAPPRFELEAAPTAVPTPEATAAPTPEPTAPPTPRPPTPTAQPAPVIAVPEPQSGLVLASWYGPGFYGNRTACGQTYTPEIIGVAHKTLPCGTLITLTYGARTMTVPVIDRGPYVAGRTLDLSNATRLALACPDLCRVNMHVGQ
jgi:hypothetical protein